MKVFTVLSATYSNPSGHKTVSDAVINKINSSGLTFDKFDSQQCQETWTAAGVNGETGGSIENTTVPVRRIENRACARVEIINIFLIKSLNKFKKISNMGF